MGYGWDEEDVGGYLAEQDFYAEECDGECRECEYRHHCDSSDYNRKRRRDW